MANAPDFSLIAGGVPGICSTPLFALAVIGLSCARLHAVHAAMIGDQSNNAQTDGFLQTGFCHAAAVAIQFDCRLRLRGRNDKWRH